MTADAQQQRPGPDPRRLAVDLFNRTWDLLTKEPRTPDEDDEMLHCVHASRFHWGQVPEHAPVNLAVGEWQCSRVYAALGRSEPAIWHARRCLRHVEAAGVEGFYLGSAYEGLARAHLAAGDAEEAARWEARAREIAEALTDAEEREVLQQDLGSLSPVAPST